MTALSSLLVACDKKDTLPLYTVGNDAVLTPSATDIAPAPADSNNVALTLNWTSPNYATDSANHKYIIEIDSTGKNFAKPFTKTVMGELSTSFLAKELNSFLLSRGYAFNATVEMDIRVTSSYANNNEKRLSNTVKVKMKPYKVPPKIVLPSTGKLYIVGGATEGSWDNPVVVPRQEFARLDETTFAGIFKLTGGGSFLFLPQNSQWTKYGFDGNNNDNNVNGDNFKAEGGDMKAPATTGWYKIVVDFQFGKFTVTPYTGVLATSLYIVGNATPGGDATGWNNPVPLPAQEFVRKNSAEFELTIALNAGKSYLFLPLNGSWAEKYGAMGGNGSNNVMGDDFKHNGGDLLSPATAGNYKITVNFAAGSAAGSSGKFTLVKL